MKLTQVSSQSEWQAYHRIRRHVLFDLRGLTGYDDQHPDDRQPNHIPLIFVDEGDAVGAVRLDIPEKGYGVVRTVAIIPERQGKGLGRAMMNAVETLARSQHVRVLEVHAASDAVEFYERVGWKMVDAAQTSPLMAKTL
ncbi:MULTISPECIES: GNAT family N-acetyltransferase [Rhizobium]|jgi:GNAT superfamily N-acetyltransferase|uniref:GNAT family N-acetyltransferase n=1 Tax=Rhizobium TaxID=379 RepID=UPI00103F2A1E|nr:MULTISPECIES: GNAT family N-acetyltransferase [Rhizobium]NEI04807.1 GNAT family N-acetyltransferase [Rhizobium ruizarguesonis]NEI54085.1 GNAT family N-acetyltransferase [Rhizobium leguminosarum]NEI82419.1 GNAT family N-acetyltransferase [Rhizobium leguminosarum]TBZ14440.1 GNAT family N-acetyltransferase [Rhizobium leguminosarum bv. viciae]